MRRGGLRSTKTRLKHGAFFTCSTASNPIFPRVISHHRVKLNKNCGRGTVGVLFASKYRSAPTEEDVPIKILLFGSFTFWMAPLTHSWERDSKVLPCDSFVLRGDAVVYDHQCIYAYAKLYSKIVGIKTYLKMIIERRSSWYYIRYNQRLLVIDIVGTQCVFLVDQPTASLMMISTSFVIKDIHLGPTDRWIHCPALFL